MKQVVGVQQRFRRSSCSDWAGHVLLEGADDVARWGVVADVHGAATTGCVATAQLRGGLPHWSGGHEGAGVQGQVCRAETGTT